MSLDRGAPGSAINRIGLFGHPFHGLVRDGALVLPNEQSMAYPQPEAVFADGYGTTHLLQVPGIEPVERTGAEQARDAAAGYQWRHQAMLSGSRLQLYGKPLNGWVYVDPNGDRWRVDPGFGESSERSFTFGASFTVALHRFGVFGRPAESYTYPVTISDWQQDEPELRWPEDNSLVDSGRLHIHALEPDGSRAIIMLCRASDAIGSAVNSPVRLPLGWVQLTIQGAGSDATVQIEVIRSRAQTVQSTEFNPPADDPHDPSNYETWYAAYYRKIATSEIVAELYEDDAPRPPPEGFAETASAACVIFVGNFSLTETSAVLIGLWPDGNGGLMELWRRHRWERAYSLPLPEVPDGPEDFERTATVSDRYSMVLDLDGVTVHELSLDAYLIEEDTFSFDPIGGPLDYARFERNRSVEFDGSAYSSSQSGAFPTLLIAVPPDALQTWAAGGAGEFEPSGSWAAGVRTTRFNLGGQDVSFREVRYSNNLVGLAIDNATASQTALLPPVAPDGPHGVRQEVAYLPAVRLYGSWCPHTGVAVWGEPEPVCFV